MNSTIEKVLRSGLIDRSMAELMEKYQLLPEGAAEQVREATREQMKKVAEEVVELAEQEALIKETRFDLERLRWPVNVYTALPDSVNRMHSPWVEGVIDRMGRYFFRVQDVKEEWFVPGYILQKSGKRTEEILEVTKLYIDEQPVAIQVTTREV